MNDEDIRWYHYIMAAFLFLLCATDFFPEEQSYESKVVEAPIEHEGASYASLGCE